eukprot:3034579-Alexandrium_andersonii.AAC.1
MQSRLLCLGSSHQDSRSDPDSADEAVIPGGAWVLVPVVVARVSEACGGLAAFARIRRRVGQLKRPYT